MNELRRDVIRARRRRAVPGAHATPAARALTVLSWNLLHGEGATVSDIVRLLRIVTPDLVLLQEATEQIDELPHLLGGDYLRSPLPGRRHGVASWSAGGFERPPSVLPLPAGALIQRVCHVITVGGMAVANVHLSHGQVLNRRQLRAVAERLPAHAAVLGDFNLVGPVLLPHFRDVGPRAPTHRMGELVPLRIDRCLVRGLACEAAFRLPRARSDHHPILVRLRLPSLQR